MIKQNKRKTPLVFRAGIVLLCTLLFTMHLTGGLYARYVAGASGSDDAVVAKFSVSETVELKGSTINLGEYHINEAINPGENVTYTFEVINNSDVTLRYRFIATNVTQNLPLTFTVVDGGEETAADEGVAIAIGVNKTVDFKIGWNEAYRDPSFCGKSDYITVTVIAEQID